MRGTRIVALLCLSTALLMLGAVGSGLLARQPEPPPAATPVVPDVAVLHAELRRCRELGLAAAEDEGCRATWAEMRRQFMGRRDAP